jgi:hypothetical protein
VPAEGRLAEDLAALMASMRADYLHLMQRMCSREYRDAVWIGREISCNFIFFSKICAKPVSWFSNFFCRKGKAHEYL